MCTKMADDLVFDVGADLLSSDLDSHSETEEEKPIRTRKDDNDSSSSSTDDVNSPLVKKKRATTTRRGLSSLIAENNNQPVLKTSTTGGSFYATRVDSIMGAMKMGKLPQAISLTADSNSDVEEEIFDTFSKKVTGKKGKDTSTRGRGRLTRTAKKGSSKVMKTPEKFAPYKESVIDLDSDSGSNSGSENRDENDSVVPVAGPSPLPAPPSPPKSAISVAATRKRRQKKELKDAYRQLDRAQLLHKTTEEDADVSIVEVTSPPPDPLRSKPIVLKVQSRSGIQRFTVKTNESFAGVFQAMASHEFVPVDRVVMFVGDRTVETYDTPASLLLNVADIIECHILRPGESRSEDTVGGDDPDVIKVKVQGKDARSRKVMAVRKSEGLGKLMQKYASSQKWCLDSLRFEFDGDEITAQDTAEDLGLEENFCIDVIAK